MQQVNNILVVYKSLKEAEIIENLLKSVPNTTLIGTNKLKDAIKFTTRNSVDLVILNLRIENKNTFDLFENHAIKNNLFVVYHTTDLNVKILQEERRHDKMKARVICHEWGDYKFQVAINQLLKIKEKSPSLNYIILKGLGGSFEKVFEDQIMYVNSIKSKLFIHTPWHVYQKNISLAKIANILGENFVRLNDSVLVHKKHKKEYSKIFHNAAT